MVQRREQPHPNTYFGLGKVVEAKAAAKAADANLIACDDELTPRQERNLEEALGMPVVDRTTVILDIFAAHAGSAEGKLQVELAQLEYNLARMRGLWTHLERLGGGIGTRGPGESQIETDRRLARDRIAALRRRLEHVKGTRAVMRAERERAALPTVALVGYTNAGKSTLLNAFTGAEVGVRDRLFHTLDPTTRTVGGTVATNGNGNGRRPGQAGRKYLVSDTVGFISKLPHQLVDAFGATLEETRRADLLAHVLDASAPELQAETMQRVVEQTLEEIGAGERPRLLVLNKIDLLGEQARDDLRLRYPRAMLVSGVTGEGLEALGARFEAELAHMLCPVELLVPYADGGSLAELHELVGDVTRENTAEGVRVRALVPARIAERFARFAIAS
jgi:GTP-binding protein HflX